MKALVFSNLQEAAHFTKTNVDKGFVVITKTTNSIEGASSI